MRTSSNLRLDTSALPPDVSKTSLMHVVREWARYICFIVLILIFCPVAFHRSALGSERGQSLNRRSEVVERVRRPSRLGSPFVPLGSWVYAAFDRLAGLGFAPSAFSNLRPWTRMECARIVAAASEDSNSLTDQSPELFRLLEALTEEFSAELQRLAGAAIGDVRVEEIYSRFTSLAGTPLSDGYHFGQTLTNDYGRPYGRGANLVTGASASASAGPVAFYLRGEYQHAAPLPAYSDGVQQLLGTLDGTPPQSPVHTATLYRFRLLDTYLAFNLKTIQLSVGRQSLWWGPGQAGPPNYSNNARPIDMVRISIPSPWKLPSFFSYLGPMRWEFIVGVMAGHHYPPHPAIDGQKISFKPTPNLELGFSRTIVFRPLTAGMFWKGFSSFGDNKSTLPGSAADVGDRRGGFDFSYRIPRLRKWLVIYSDGMTDDDTSPLGAPQRALMNPGIYLPQIPRIPKLDVRAEVVWSDPPEISNRAGRYIYYNGAYHDSYTNGGQLLGSWVGREGHGIQIWSTYWRSPRCPVQVGYRKAQVDRDFIPRGGSIQDFFLRAKFQLRQRLELSTFVQHELWSFPILAPLKGPNTAAAIELTWHPKWSRVFALE